MWSMLFLTDRLMVALQLDELRPQPLCAHALLAGAERLGHRRLPAWRRLDCRSYKCQLLALTQRRWMIPAELTRRSSCRMSPRGPLGRAGSVPSLE